MTPTPPQDPLASYLAHARSRALAQLPQPMADAAIAAHQRDVLAHMATLKATDPSLSYEEAAIRAIFSTPTDSSSALPGISPLPIPIPEAPPAPVHPAPVPPIPALPPLPLPPEVRASWLERLLHALGLRALGLKGKVVLVSMLLVGTGGAAYAGAGAVPALVADDPEVPIDLAGGVDTTLPAANGTAEETGRVLYVRDHREAITVGEQVERFFVPPEIGGFTLFETILPEGGCVTVDVIAPSGNVSSRTQACPGNVVKNASFVGNGTWTVRYTFVAFSGRLAVNAVHDDAARLAVLAAKTREEGGEERPRAWPAPAGLPW